MKLHLKYTHESSSYEDPRSESSFGRSGMINSLFACLIKGEAFNFATCTAILLIPAQNFRFFRFSFKGEWKKKDESYSLAKEEPKTKKTLRFFFSFTNYNTFGNNKLTLSRFFFFLSTSYFLHVLPLSISSISSSQKE